MLHRRPFPAIPKQTAFCNLLQNNSDIENFRIMLYYIFPDPRPSVDPWPHGAMIAQAREDTRSGETGVFKSASRNLLNTTT